MLYRIGFQAAITGSTVTAILGVVVNSPFFYIFTLVFAALVWDWMDYEERLRRRIIDAMKAANLQCIEIDINVWTNRIYAVTEEGVTPPRLRLMKFKTTKGASQEIEMVTLEAWDAPRRPCTQEWLIDYARTMGPALP